MSFKEELDRVTLPNKLKRNNKECIIDIFRKKIIQVTPEEIVRQKVAKYFVDVLEVPINLVQTEVNLSLYGSNKKGRIDILINKLEDNIYYPVAVIECKSEDINLSSQTFKQASTYADEIGADYVFITNGSEILCWYYNKDKESYEKVSNIPNYKEMLLNKIDIEEYKPYQIERIGLEEFNSEVFEEMIEYGILGEDTPDKIKGNIINLYQCLMDLSHTFPKIEKTYFKVVEDLGLKYLNYGDASGSSFGTGTYRVLLMEDADGNNRLINLGIMATCKTINDKKYGNSQGKSVLVVALDDFDKDYMIVQINLNKFMTSLEGKMKITHNGVVAMKNARKEELIELVKAQNSKLIDGNKIVFGEVNSNCLLYMDTPDLVKIIANIIDYSIVRDKYKKSVSMKNKQAKRISYCKI